MCKILDSGIFFYRWEPFATLVFHRFPPKRTKTVKDEWCILMNNSFWKLLVRYKILTSCLESTSYWSSKNYDWKCSYRFHVIFDDFHRCYFLESKKYYLKTTLIDENHLSPIGVPYDDDWKLARVIQKTLIWMNKHYHE